MQFYRNTTRMMTTDFTVFLHCHNYYHAFTCVYVWCVTNNVSIQTILLSAIDRLIITKDICVRKQSAVTMVMLDTLIKMATKWPWSQWSQNFRDVLNLSTTHFFFLEHNCHSEEKYYTVHSDERLHKQCMDEIYVIACSSKRHKISSIWTLRSHFQDQPNCFMSCASFTICRMMVKPYM